MFLDLYEYRARRDTPPRPRHQPLTRKLETMFIWVVGFNIVMLFLGPVLRFIDPGGRDLCMANPVGKPKYAVCNPISRLFTACSVRLMGRRPALRLPTYSSVKSVDTVKMSLSPRPQRLTIIKASRSMVGAIFMTSAMACAGSSAGMMPSTVDRS